MFGSWLVLKKDNDSKEVLLIFDFKKITVSMMVDGVVVTDEIFNSWDELFLAFKFFSCKEEWCFYEI